MIFYKKAQDSVSAPWLEHPARAAPKRFPAGTWWVLTIGPLKEEATKGGGGGGGTTHTIVIKNQPRALGLGP